MLAYPEIDGEFRRWRAKYAKDRSATNIFLIIEMIIYTTVSANGLMYYDLASRCLSKRNTDHILYHAVII